MKNEPPARPAFNKRGEVMKAKRYVKIYTLYKSLSGWTEYSIHYGSVSKEILHVAAYSCKQAKYLAWKGEWYRQGKFVGIVEYSGNASDWGWKHADGTHSMGSKYEHGKRFDSSKLKFKEAHE